MHLLHDIPAITGAISTRLGMSGLEYLKFYISFSKNL